MTNRGDNGDLVQNLQRVRLDLLLDLCQNGVQMGGDGLGALFYDENGIIR